MHCPSCGAAPGETSPSCPACGAAPGRVPRADAWEERTLAGKYRLEARLGEGGMGRVYRARQLALDKPVVLKLLHRELLEDAAAVQRFRREARAASKLNHPNAISVLDYGEDAASRQHYIAMEWVNGQDLFQLLHAAWPLDERRVVHLVAQVLAALADAHASGVVHRDLKPENIMVEQRRSAPDFVKVLDFGIAKLLDAGGGEDGAVLTRAGFVCGTPEYLSPEQARGAVLDARSDLYAVGVILYQLVTGLLPFQADSALGFAQQHLSAPPPRPSQRRPGVRVSPALEALILRALEKDPALRPQSAEAFRAELLALELAPASPPAQAPVPPVPPVSRSATLTRTERVEVQTRTELEPSPGRPRPRRTWLAAGVVALAAVAAVPLFIRPAAPPAAGAPWDAPRAAVADGARTELLARDGDAAFARGALDEAATCYREAWAHGGAPELALKLGELAWQQDRTAEARGWWGRYLRERSDSPARAYIRHAFADLDGAPRAP